MLETVLAAQFQTQLEETGYLYPFQSSFKPGHGTKTSLHTCGESVTFRVLLDFSVAFDTVGHFPPRATS